MSPFLAPDAARRAREGSVNAQAYITTSWDDGHPLDLRLAELLTRYHLPATFYIPRSAETKTVAPAVVRELSAAFEIGGHTLHHAVLTECSDARAQDEIAGCKAWLEDVTGKRCDIFAPPRGRYAARHVRMVRDAGYVGLRSVELVSLDLPRRAGGILLVPTTIQAHPHGLLAYAMNSFKRRAYGNLWRYVRYGRSADWGASARALLALAVSNGGVFHLWGHSWELEHAGQWRRLEEVLHQMSELTKEAPALDNGQLCRLALAATFRAPGRELGAP
jgi:peptidoglycan/xylan/chitin deacetylase (PgdA/CDA1 family)